MSPDTRLLDVLSGVHGANERMNMRRLDFATRFLCSEAVRTLS
jgi:hypothetical protein